MTHIFSQNFLGIAFDALHAACAHYEIKFKLFYGMEVIQTNINVGEKPENIMFLETDSPNEMINLKVATEIEDVCYIPSECKSGGLKWRLDEWLGLQSGAIEPCPASLPISNPASITHNMRKIEDEHKVWQHRFWVTNFY